MMKKIGTPPPYSVTTPSFSSNLFLTNFIFKYFAKWEEISQGKLYIKLIDWCLMPTLAIFQLYIGICSIKITIVQYLICTYLPGDQLSLLFSCLDSLPLFQHVWYVLTFQGRLILLTVFCYLPGNFSVTMVTVIN